jgi:signal transduction histidine kinase
MRAGVFFDLSCAEDMCVSIDQPAFQMILSNLLRNAVDAMPEGGTIRVTVQLINGMAAIAVHDLGRGIPVADRPRIFKPFFSTKQAASSARGGTYGTGLGLWVCRSLAEKNGGTITFDSIEGKGTTFTLLLPVEQ